jgi:uncharacterized protein YqjF (DUF2071 family)
MNDNHNSPKIIMRQRWSDLLFLHWAIDPEHIQALLPDELVVDTFDGVAYVGIVAFSMTNVGLSWFTPVPGVSAFLECNVRTYVRQRDLTQPGVWFFSLEAANMFMATMGRAAYSLPYFYAKMKTSEDRVQVGASWQRTVHYETHRAHPGAHPGMCELEYVPVQSVIKQARLGSIEEFLIERYRLYAMRGNQLYCASVHHHPYRIEQAHLISVNETLTSAAGIDLPASFPLVHFSREVLAEIEPLKRANEQETRTSRAAIPGTIPQPA